MDVDFGAPQGYQEMSAFLHEQTAASTDGIGTAPLSLYHCTGVVGLKGILESRKLWASNAVFTNDRSELLHSLNFVNRIVTEPKFAEGKAGDPNLQADEIILEVVRDFYRYLHVFLVCFCTNDDLLSQWRGYGTDGGYSVGFSGPELEKLTSQRLQLVCVNYDEIEQKDLLCAIIRRWRESAGTLPPRESDTRPWNIGALIFAESLSYLAVRFKNSGFPKRRSGGSSIESLKSFGTMVSN